MVDDLNLVVAGPIPRDTITTHLGQTIEKYGCALYTTAVLSSWASEGSTVYPVSHVRKSDVPEIKSILAGFDHVDLTHINSDLDQGDVINLHYVDKNRRNEQQTGFMNPLLPEDFKDLLHCDAFVFVPITDFEVPLETLRYLKENSDGLVVFDAHGPTNGCSKHGERFHKFWVDRDRWLPYIDILKMNLEEAKCSWFEGEYGPDELVGVEELTMDELPRFAAHCLDRGVKGLYVTLDQHGCAVYFKNTDGKIREHLVKRVLVDPVIDTTGCGDSFAGGLAYGFLKTQDYVKACQYGNCAGAFRCGSTDLDVYGTIQDAEAQIEETYGT